MLLPLINLNHLPVQGVGRCWHQSVFGFIINWSMVMCTCSVDLAASMFDLEPCFFHLICSLTCWILFLAGVGGIALGGGSYLQKNLKAKLVNWTEISNPYENETLRGWTNVKNV